MPARVLGAAAFVLLGIIAAATIGTRRVKRSQLGTEPHSPSPKLRPPRPASERYARGARDPRRRRATAPGGTARGVPAEFVPVVTSFLAEHVDA